MRLGLSLYQYLECTVCKNSVESHDSDCPVGCLQALQAKVCKIKCPLCHKGTLDINLLDWYECRACQSQFSASACIPYDSANLQEVSLIDYDGNQAIPVLVLPEKGSGQIRTDLAIKTMAKEVEKARRRAKRRKVE